MPAGRPLKYKNKEDMQVIIDRYFDACAIRRKEIAGVKLSEEEIAVCDITHDLHPTVCGLALILDLTRETLIQYKGRKEFTDTVKKGRLRVEAYNEQKLHGSACAGVIFGMKNNFGWKDKTETDITTKGQPITGIERKILD